jgi:hypothetical protein
MFYQIALTMHDHNFFQITSWHVGIILQVHGLKEENLQVISKHHKKKLTWEISNIGLKTM